MGGNKLSRKVKIAAFWMISFSTLGIIAFFWFLFKSILQDFYPEKSLEVGVILLFGIPLVLFPSLVYFLSGLSLLRGKEITTRRIIISSFIFAVPLFFGMPSGIINRWLTVPILIFIIAFPLVFLYYERKNT